MTLPEDAPKALRTIAHVAEEYGSALDTAFRVLGDGVLTGSRVKILGFYEELWPARAGVPAGKIREFVQSAPSPDERRVMNYLESGYELLSVMGAEEDVLGSDHRILGGHSVKSDGEWIWRDSLWFYLAEYHVGLPDEFLEKVHANNYEVPVVPDAVLEELSLRIREIW